MKNQFFMDEESPCGSTKSGYHKDINTTQWDCGCFKKTTKEGDFVQWCGWMRGNIYQKLPGIFEPFVSDNTDIKIIGYRNGKKLYQK